MPSGQVPHKAVYKATIDTSTTLHLEAYTSYRFQVVAYNSKGDGPASNVVGPLTTPEASKIDIIDLRTFNRPISKFKSSALNTRPQHEAPGNKLHKLYILFLSQSVSQLSPSVSQSVSQPFSPSVRLSIGPFVRLYVIQSANQTHRPSA